MKQYRCYRCKEVVEGEEKTNRSVKKMCPKCKKSPGGGKKRCKQLKMVIKEIINKEEKQNECKRNG